MLKEQEYVCEISEHTPAITLSEMARRKDRSEICLKNIDIIEELW